MRILICSDYYPSLSGIAKYVEGISDVLKNNHKISVICFRKPEQKTTENIDGIQVNRIYGKDIPLFMEKNKDNFDLIIIGTFPYLDSAIKYFKNTIYVLPSVRKTSLRFLPQYKNRKSRAKEIIQQEINGIRKCEKIVYPSKNVKKQVEKEYNIEKGLIIPSGVNLNQLKPSNLKKYEGITIANFDPRKGIDKLIKTASLSRANFIILGDGELRVQYQNLIKEFNLEGKIRLLGKRPSQEYLKKSKIFILPSRYEAFGLVLLEAMASGLPCIAFKPDGKNILTASDEIIKDKITGFLVKDEAEMAEKIDLLLEDNNLREKLGKAARKQAEKYSWKKTADAILRLANS